MKTYCKTLRSGIKLISLSAALIARRTPAIVLSLRVQRKQKKTVCQDGGWLDFLCVLRIKKNAQSHAKFETI